MHPHASEAVRLVILRLCRARVREAEHATQEQFISQLDAGDAKTARLPDGTYLGKITKVAGRVTPQVTDERAFLEWVKNNHPTEVVEQVRDSYRQAILATAKKYGQGVDETTGEVIPGVECRHGDAYVSVRTAKDASDIVAERWSELVGETVLGLEQAGEH